MIQGFINFHKDKTTSAEGRLAAKYKNSAAEVERLQTSLLKHIRPVKSSKGFVPGFDSGAEQIAEALDATEKALEVISSDITEFLGLCSGEFSMDRLFKDRNKYRKTLSDVKFATKNITLREMRAGDAATAAEAESTPRVQEALAKQDRIETEYAPKLADVEERIAKAKAILAKY